MQNSRVGKFIVFIVFEGGEGVGKSTQIELVFNALLSQKLLCIKTREPGGTPLAEKIRSLFKEKTTDSPTALTELYLICAARAQHVEKVIAPNLAQGNIILCDRFIDSTYVYQHILGNLSKEIIDKASSTILQGLMPDLTFIFDCDYKTASNRMQGNENRQNDRFDSSHADFHKAILDGYKQIYENKLAHPCQKIPLRILINASVSIEEIFTQIQSAFKAHLSINL
ncbi:MAG: dTMP kinase [Bdellovibrionota bacterium]